MASPPSSVSSSPTCGPTNSTRRRSTVPFGGNVEGSEDAIAEIGADIFALLSFRGEANQHVARGPEVLHGRPWEATFGEGGAHLGELGRLLVSHLDQGTAGEVEPEIQSAQDHRHDADQDQQRQKRLPPPGACP